MEVDQRCHAAVYPASASLSNGCRWSLELKCRSLDEPLGCDLGYMIEVPLGAPSIWGTKILP